MTPPRSLRILPALLLSLLIAPSGLAQEEGFVQKLSDNALQLLRTGKPEEALKGFEQIYTSYGKSGLSADALYQVAAYHYPTASLRDLGSATRDQILRALALFNKIRKEYPTSSRAPEALYRLGLLALEPDNPKTSFDEAYAAFTSVTNVYPESPLAGPALYGGAAAQMRSGAFAVAQDDFARLLERYPALPETASARLAYGYCLYRSGDYARAMEEYQKVRDRNPGKPEAEVARERITLLHRLRLLPAVGRTVVYRPDGEFAGKVATLGLRSVSALALGPDGNLLVIDAKQGIVLQIGAGGRAIGQTPFAGVAAADSDPRGNLVMAGEGQIQVGKRLLPLTRPEGSTPRPIRDLSGMAVDGDGRVYVGDSRTMEVVQYGRNLDFRAAVYRSASGRLGPLRAGLDDQLYILDTKEKTVVVYAEGKSTTRLRLDEAPASILEPVDLAVDDLGDLYVCDAASGRVVVLDPSGKTLLAGLQADKARGGLLAPDRIEVDHQGRIYI